MEKDLQTLVATIREGAQKYAPIQLELLEKQFSRIDCGTHNEEGNRKVIDLLSELLRSVGAQVEEHPVPGLGIHLVGRIRPQSPKGKIILNAHTDTVFLPGDTAAHPFHIEGDWAYGLGIADCKGGILTAIHAVKILKEADLLPNWEIAFVFNCDEEIGTPSGRDVFAQEAKNADLALVFEPARGENGILTQRKGMAMLDLQATGISAHAGISYLEGRSAVLELSHKIDELYQKNDPEMGVFYNIASLTSSDKNCAVADYASAGGIATVTSKQAEEKIAADLAAISAKPSIDGCTFQAKVICTMPAMLRNEGIAKLYEHLHKAGQLLGQDLPEQATGGASDANLFASFGVPVVCGLGPFMTDIHTFNERLHIPSIEEKTALTAVALATLD